MRRVLTDHPGIKETFILSSEGGIYARPTAVQTVLGSCVAVTFFCPKDKIGGIFHALLPRREQYSLGNDTFDHYKYVDSAIEYVCNGLLKRGVKQQDIECKVFGGANAIFQNEISVGPKNIKAAFDVLAAYPLRVLASQVGGVRGRKLMFLTHTGDVFIKIINKSS